jgi:hypothetical protein
MDGGTPVLGMICTFALEEKVKRRVNSIYLEKKTFCGWVERFFIIKMKI